MVELMSLLQTHCFEQRRGREQMGWKGDDREGHGRIKALK